MNSFDEFVELWKSETKDIKIKNPDLLFLVVYPDKLEWNFSVEKQCQTTVLMVSVNEQVLLQGLRQVDLSSQDFCKES